MNFQKYLKSAIAGFTAFAMAVTMLPVNNMGSVQAASTDGNMVVHWDMTTNADGTLNDLTGNEHNGVLNGSVTSTQIDDIDVLDMTGGYVDIPDGTIGTDTTEITVNMLVKITENISASWMWCLGSSNKRYMYFTGCCSANQGSVMRGGVGCVPTDLLSTGNGWSYESVINGTEALTKDEWQNVTVTYTDGGKFIFYKNGEKQAETLLSEGSAGEFTLQDLMTAGDDRDGYMGWSFYTGADPKFQGKVADFRIYDKAMTDTEVAELAEEINDQLNNLADSDFSVSDIDLTEENCLGTNTSKNEITSNLSLPATTTISATKEAQITKWTSSNPDIIAEDGTVKRPLIDQTVTLTASVTRNNITVDKALTFKVLGSATAAELVKLDADELSIPNADDIRGNITLPATGANGSKITWTSSNEAVIRSTNNGEILAGAVTRQAKDTKVTLTATLVYGSETTTKNFVCTVKEAAEKVETTDYLFAYFPYTSTKDERIYFGISEDGLNFTALNNGSYVLESVLGTHGLRDPFIIRSPEGDKFYLIATDLTVAGITQNGVTYPGQSWDKNQVSGSQKIMVWESTDLVNWSDQRECKVAVDTAGCTWAPEAYWDDATGQYVVFWASKVSDDNNAKQRVYYATTRDFYTFSEAQVWIEENGSVIDTTVIKVGDYYYRYTKNEDGSTNVYGTPSKRVYCERSKSLTSTNWELVNANSLDVSGGQIEGPCIFKLNSDDVENAKAIAALKGYPLTGDEVYCLAADQTGSTIFPGLSSDITSGSFNVLGTTKSATVDGTALYTMPEPDASHGTIMPITSEEYNNLMLAYDSSYATAAADFIAKAEAAEKELTLSTTTVTSDLTLPSATSNGAKVTWASSNEAVITSAGKVTRPEKADTTVELTATITVAGNDVVRNQVKTKSFVVTVKKQETVTPPTTPEVKKYTVKFNSNGGSKVASKTVESGKKVTAPKNPTRRNYLFAGWYNGKTKYNFNTPVTKNLTLTAKWKKVSVGTSKISSLKNKKSKQCVVTAKKISGAAGYQFTYSTNKKFKKAKKSVTSKKPTVTIKKLKKGKTYYFKVRAYKLDSKNKKVYGSYSKVKKIKITK